MNSLCLKSLLGAGVLCAALSLAMPAGAATIDFEGYAQPSGAIRQVANGTNGFNWLGVSASAPDIVTNKPLGQNTGYHNMSQAPGNEIGFASFGYAQLTSANAFTINSLFLASAYKDDRTLQISGTGSGGVAYSQNLLIGVDAATPVTLNWTGLTSFIMQWAQGSAGTTVPGWPTGDQFAFDNIRYNEAVTPVPLPAAAW